MIHLNARFYNQLEILNGKNGDNTSNISSSIFTLNGKHLLNIDYENNIFENTNKLLNKLSKVEKFIRFR